MAVDFTALQVLQQMFASVEQDDSEEEAEDVSEEEDVIEGDAENVSNRLSAVSLNEPEVAREPCKRPDRQREEYFTLFIFIGYKSIHNTIQRQHKG